MHVLTYCSYIKDNQKLALLLDYDGTLAAICAHPNFTEMTPITTEVLKSLAANPNIFMAVISGRGVENVRNKVSHNLLVEVIVNIKILYLF